MARDASRIPLSLLPQAHRRLAMPRSGKDERSIIRACGGSRQALSKGFSPPKSPANRSKVLFVAEIAERAKGMEIETPVPPVSSVVTLFGPALRRSPRSTGNREKNLLALLGVPAVNVFACKRRYNVGVGGVPM